jgi:hypothetical protein
MYGLGGDSYGFSGGMQNLPANMSGALGYAPTGVYSGLDPSASAGAYGGNPLGGGAAGQAAAAPQSDPNQMMQMMLIQSAMQNASKIGKTASIQDNNFQQYAQPQAQVTPQMMGNMMMGGR